MRQLIEALKEAKHTGTFFSLTIGGDHLKVFEAIRKQVIDLLGELDTGGPPHVTVLYMGKEVPQAGLVAKVEKILDGSRRAVALAPYEVGFFPATKNSGGRTPILIRYRSPTLGQLHASLLRGLASHVTQDQFPDFHAHATLGYLPRALTGEEEEALGAIPLPRKPWRPRKMTLTRGETKVRDFDLEG